MALAVGVTVGAGTYLLLRARTFPVILGLGLLGYAANLFLFSSGRLTVGEWPVTSPDRTHYPDPLPQALVLTAIVIGFGMTAFVVVLALRARVELGSDHVDGRATQADDEEEDGNGEDRESGGENGVDSSAAPTPGTGESR